MGRSSVGDKNMKTNETEDRNQEPGVGNGGYDGSSPKSNVQSPKSEESRRSNGGGPKAEDGKNGMEGPPADVTGREGLAGPRPSDGKGAKLLDELAGQLTRFVVLPKFAAETLALWVVHTYAFELRDVSTYIGIESPEKRCGKTTLLGVLSKLVNRPVVAANISPPAFFRVIQEMKPTLLIDEADTFLQGNDELKGILNAGYHPDSAFVLRVKNQERLPSSGPERCSWKKSSPSPQPITDSFSTEASPAAPGEGEPFDSTRSESTFREDVHLGKNAPMAPAADRTSESRFFEVQRSGAGEQPGVTASISSSPRHLTRDAQPSRLERFSCWCPKLMSAIGRLPDTLADRCIVIRMQRKRADEKCERLRKLETSRFKEQCEQFVRQHQEAIGAARPEIPESLNDRAADIWEPLLVIADLAGGDWPEKGRQAATSLSASADENNPISSLLLDIFVVFTMKNAEKLF